MNGGPNFEDLIGPEVSGAERDRLRRMHELLLAAGPPPELSPEIEAGPTLAMTLDRRRSVRRFRGRAALLVAAALAVAAVFVGGYAVGNHNGGKAVGAPGGRTLVLHGTAAARGAFASLHVAKPMWGNWPMTLAVSGLGRGEYEVYVMRDGKPWAPCGTFVVRRSGVGITVTLNAPYALRAGDSWVVTKQTRHDRGPGRPVLVPA